MNSFYPDFKEAVTVYEGFEDLKKRMFMILSGSMIRAVTRKTSKGCSGFVKNTIA